MKDALTKQEWIVMETLWKKHPMFLSEIMTDMKSAVNWQKSTFSTYLKKLCDNGYIGYRTISGNRAYYPLVEREACVSNESRYMLSKLTEHSAKMFLTCLIKDSELSDNDRADLQQLINDLGKDEGGRP